MKINWPLYILLFILGFSVNMWVFNNSIITGGLLGAIAIYFSLDCDEREV